MAETQQTDKLGTGPASKYQIVEALKTGGTAAIYLAVMRGENDFTREVVVKRPLPHLVADRRLRAMFIDEAHIASRLSHPNIVQVIDLVAREDDVYLVLEYLKGRDVREILKRCRELERMIPLDVAVWIMSETAAGLDFAHDAIDSNNEPLNLVHRDVSPKNVRITDRGAVKVIDFGIARVEHRITETAPGSVKGTMGYMSPEQVMGDVIDRRSDVFALGICMFQLLTGRNPFDAPDLKGRIHLLIHAPVPSVREFNATIDEPLAAIVARCLERDAKDRYPSAGALQRDLETYLAELRVASPRQRLVSFLEEIFPDIHDHHPKLQAVLSTMSGLEAKSDELLSWGDLDADTHISSKARADTPPPSPTTAEMPQTQKMSTAVRAPPQRPMSQSVLVALVGALLVALIGAAWVVGRLGGRSNVIVQPAPTLTALDDPPPRDPVAKDPVPPDPATTDPDPRPTKVVPRKEKSSPKAPASRLARDYFETGVHLSKQGDLADALFLYELAYAHSVKSPNPAIYRNLGLLHERMGHPAKVRACFQMYLDRSPGGADGDRIRSILASLPATKPTRCVSDGEARAAKKRAARVGAKLDTWMREAGVE